MNVVILITTRDRPKVVFPLTAVTESGTVSEQLVSAVTETHCSLTAETESERMPNCCPLLNKLLYIDTQYTLAENILCLTYVCL